MAALLPAQNESVGHFTSEAQSYINYSSRQPDSGPWVELYIFDTTKAPESGSCPRMKVTNVGRQAQGRRADQATRKRRVVREDLKIKNMFISHLYLVPERSLIKTR